MFQTILNRTSCYRARNAEIEILQSAAIMRYESRRPFTILVNVEVSDGQTP